MQRIRITGAKRGQHFSLGYNGETTADHHHELVVPFSDGFNYQLALDELDSIGETRVHGTPMLVIQARMYYSCTLP